MNPPMKGMKGKPPFKNMKSDKSSEHLEQLILKLAQAGLTVWNELAAEYIDKKRPVNWDKVNKAMMLLEETESKFGS